MSFFKLFEQIGWLRRRSGPLVLTFERVSPTAESAWRKETDEEGGRAAAARPTAPLVSVLLIGTIFAMAEYDLTPKIGGFVDPHLLLPVLNWLEEAKVRVPSLPRHLSALTRF